MKLAFIKPYGCWLPRPVLITRHYMIDFFRFKKVVFHKQNVVPHLPNRTNKKTVKKQKGKK